MLTLLLCATAVAMAGAADARTTRDAAGRQWKIEPTPNPGRADISTLASVACVSVRACTAVGSSAHALSSPTLPLAERWNGTRWRIQSIPAPKRTSDVLFGVSCASGQFCVAVGDAFREARRRDTPLVEVWRGKRWRVQSAPAGTTPSVLYSVSCPSESSCMAVGSTVAGGKRAIAERWDGAAWHLQSISKPSKSTQLLGVSCSSARSCTAVGYQQGTNSTRAFAESWNGTKWRTHLPRSPHAGMFEAVSCTSPSACTATGGELDTGTALAERWNGTTWHLERTPNPPDYRSSISTITLDGVACTSRKSCVATGDYTPGGAAAYFTESWNGKRWRLESVPRPAGFMHGALLGIACVPARCTGVGAYTGNVRLQLTLAMAK